MQIPIPPFIQPVVALAVLFLVAMIFFWFIERFFAANRQQPFFRKGYKSDVLYWFMTPILSRSAFKYVLVVILLPFIFKTPENMQAYLEMMPVGELPLPLQIFLMLFVGDFIAYWSHRAFHTGKLWPFHAVHHSSEEVDWLSAVRMHPVNQGAMYIIQVLALLALGFDPRLLAAYLPIITFHAILTHANVPWDFGPLRYVIASPVFHRWHHTVLEEGRDKNFALMFPVFDLMFGTLYMPKGRLPEKFGASTPVPEGFFAQMIYPFWWPKDKA